MTDLTQAAEEFLATFAMLAPPELDARPHAQGWSRRDVVAHLVLTYGRTAGEMEKRLAKGHPTARPATLKERALQFVLIRCGYFPRGRKAPEAVDPALHTVPPGDGAQLAGQFRQALAAMEDAIRRAEAAFGSKAAIATHHRLGPLTAAQWRGFHAVHARHHARQMERIGKAAGQQVSESARQRRG